MNMNSKIRFSGLWKETSKDGQEYLSGKVTANLKLVIFPNKKTASGQPDFVAYLTGSETEKSAGFLTGG